jgi:hypothetical protein
MSSAEKKNICEIFLERKTVRGKRIIGEMVDDFLTTLESKVPRRFQPLIKPNNAQWQQLKEQIKQPVIKYIKNNGPLCASIVRWHTSSAPLDKQIMEIQLKFKHTPFFTQLQSDLNKRLKLMLPPAPTGAPDPNAARTGAAARRKQAATKAAKKVASAVQKLTEILGSQPLQHLTNNLTILNGLPLAELYDREDEAGETITEAQKMGTKMVGKTVGLLQQIKDKSQKENIMLPITRLLILSESLSSKLKPTVGMLPDGHYRAAIEGARRKFGGRKRRRRTRKRARKKKTRKQRRRKKKSRRTRVHKRRRTRVHKRRRR